jgi:hypothetical protein
MKNLALLATAAGCLASNVAPAGSLLAGYSHAKDGSQITKPPIHPELAERLLEDNIDSEFSVVNSSTTPSSKHQADDSFFDDPDDAFFAIDDEEERKRARTRKPFWASFSPAASSTASPDFNKTRQGKGRYRGKARVRFRHRSRQATPSPKKTTSKVLYASSARQDSTTSATRPSSPNENNNHRILSGVRIGNSGERGVVTAGAGAVTATTHRPGVPAPSKDK